MVSLSSAEQRGITLVALMRCGKLKSFHCSDCSEMMQEGRDCEMRNSNESPIWYSSDLGEFYSCPVRFIPNTVMSFLDEYDHRELYPSVAKSYGEENPRFWESVKFLKSELQRIENEDSNSQSSSNSDDNLGKLRSIFGKGGA